MGLVKNNQYKFKFLVKDIVDNNLILKKYVKPTLKKIADSLPQPRDFILKKLPPEPICCEIGVWKGEFAERIIKVVKPKKLYLVDPWKYFGEDYFYNRTQPEKKFEQVAQDRRMKMVVDMFTKEIEDRKVEIVRKTSDEALDDFEDNSLDFVYIDGNHSYEFVKRDIENYYKKTKQGGIIAGDDYRMEDVSRAFDEFISENEIQKFWVKNDQFVIQKM